jgi:hypothetical protein
MVAHTTGPAFAVVKSLYRSLAGSEGYGLIASINPF